MSSITIGQCRHARSPWLPSLAIALLLLAPTVASAHPHAWIDLRVTVQTNAAGEATGLTQEWLFDPFYSLIVLEELGPEARGDTPDEQRAAIAARMIENLSEYHYFTEVMYDHEALAGLRAEDYHLSADQDRLLLRFDLLLPSPLSLDAAPLRYAIADPTYYIEMLHEETPDAVRVQSVARDCAIKLQPPNPSPAMIARAAALDIDQTGDPGMGGHFAEWVEIRCD